MKLNAFRLHLERSSWLTRLRSGLSIIADGNAATMLRCLDMACWGMLMMLPHLMFVWGQVHNSRTQLATAGVTLTFEAAKSNLQHVRLPQPASMHNN